MVIRRQEECLLVRLLLLKSPLVFYSRRNVLIGTAQRAIFSLTQFVCTCDKRLPAGFV